MRKPIIAGNWKMNGTIASGSILIEAFNNVLEGMDLSCDVVVCPPFTALERAVTLTRNTAIEVGAQTMDYHDAGAFTGEISPLMLTEVGVSYVIIGHSERREYYGETDETVNAKIKSAFRHNLIPIVCVGESLEQREAGHTLEWITSQLKGALQDIPKEQVSQLIIAYEPIWAIGTGKTATAAQAETVCKSIRDYIRSVYGHDVSDRVRIQYGGSVKSDNSKQILGQPNIDGALVGGASLVVDDFVEIIKAANMADV
ncbi:triose-phosphate isomerase [Veillonella denticariosi JCM 15641]|uniref:Triosephosphate isomerase n=1 Tax=Veillonella denticariosi JCM 15641 TaxID=1298594 RepID=A0A2S7Z7Q5_9FIRM|nr:triose-phosphate isomerase [Veillonella denticariosi]PQL19263.1 triose-phosphate isomerase [Veillonella denticariosi JCM 15641]